MLGPHDETSVYIIQNAGRVIEYAGMHIAIFTVMFTFVRFAIYFLELNMCSYFG